MLSTARHELPPQQQQQQKQQQQALSLAELLPLQTQLPVRLLHDLLTSGDRSDLLSSLPLLSFANYIPVKVDLSVSSSRDLQSERSCEASNKRNRASQSKAVMPRGFLVKRHNSYVTIGHLPPSVSPHHHPVAWQDDDDHDPRPLSLTKKPKHMSHLHSLHSSHHHHPLAVHHPAISAAAAAVVSRHRLPHRASYPSSLSPHSDRPESPEPEVLDLRVSNFLYSPTLQSLLKSVQPTTAAAVGSANPASAGARAKLLRQQENLTTSGSSHKHSKPSTVGTPVAVAVTNGGSSSTGNPGANACRKGPLKKRRLSLDLDVPTPAATTVVTASPVTASNRSAATNGVKKHKAIRKIPLDEHKSSPVSGTFILESDEEDADLGEGAVRRSGDIDPSLNVVIETEEARAELAKIENRIGDYVCCLCRCKFESAFGLAQHRCPRIVHIEYRCSECEKVFNCPANLASHRRWHKPRDARKAIAATSITECTA